MLKVSLAISGGGGFIAAIENDDGDAVQLTYDPYETTEATVCTEAAAMLREAAARFDLLATKKKRCHSTTHDAVNRARVAV